MSPSRSYSDLAHDIRTPLSVIQSTCEAALIGSDTGPDADAYRTILDQVARASEVANALSLKSSINEV